MIHLERTRFGNIEFDESSAISFPRGIIGFSEETEFAIIERDGGTVAYLQSLRTPSLALPVIDASRLRPAYPEGPLAMSDLARSIGASDNQVAILIVVYVRPEDRSLRANLLAPIVVDAEKRRAYQIILDPEKYSPSSPLGGLSETSADKGAQPHERATATP